MYLVVITSFKLNSCAYILESKPNNDETYDAVFAYEIFYGAAESDFFVPTRRKRKPVIGKNYPLFRKTVLEICLFSLISNCCLLLGILAMDEAAEPDFFHHALVNATVCMTGRTVVPATTAGWKGDEDLWYPDDVWR